MSRVTWSTELLRLLKAPETPANYQFLNQWATSEHKGGPALADGSNNPFFTTAGAGSTVGPFKSGTYQNWNSLGVATYPNLEIGVLANAYHISTQYPSIRDALKSGNPGAFANNSNFQGELRRWSGKGYAGVSSVQAAPGPVGATVDTTAVAKAASDAAKGAVNSHGVIGSINGVIRHVPLVAQTEDAAGATADAAGSVVGFLGKLTDPHYILRGLQIVAGAALVGMGAVLLARQVALAADLPDPALLLGPAGKAGTAVAGAAAAGGRRREGERESNDDQAAAYHEGVASGRRQKVDRLRLDREAGRASRPDDDIPF